MGHEDYPVGWQNGLVTPGAPERAFHPFEDGRVCERMLAWLGDEDERITPIEEAG